MSPRVGAKSNQGAIAPVAKMTAPEPGPELVGRLLADIAAKQAEMLPQSRWVGRDFAAAARAMHEGRVPADLIHGQASSDEAQALRDEGIEDRKSVVEGKSVAVRVDPGGRRKMKKKKIKKKK